MLTCFFKQFNHIMNINNKLFPQVRHVISAKPARKQYRKLDADEVRLLNTMLYKVEAFYAEKNIPFDRAMFKLVVNSFKVNKKLAFTKSCSFIILILLPLNFE